MRLGLVLGKSLQEIRSLPYPEFRKWMLFYALEPWGFEDREYHTASLRAEIYNTKIHKRSQAKTAKPFMRDMQKEIFRYLHREKLRATQEVGIDLETLEGREQASEKVIEMFSTMFGKRVERKDK